MPRPKTPKERAEIINRIAELVEVHGHLTTTNVVEMFGLHRGTAEKYIRMVINRGNAIRHGRCGVFRDERAIIDFDLKRYSHTQGAVQ